MTAPATDEDAIPRVRPPRPPIDPWLPLIRGKCREVARHYPGKVDVEDLVQHVALWWYQVDTRWLAEYVTDDTPSRLRRAIFRTARAAAERERMQAGPAEVFDQARYRAAELLQMIPVALDPGGLPGDNTIHEDGPRAHGNLAEGGDLLAALLDVRAALDWLTDEDRAFLDWMDEIRWNYDAAAIALGIAADSVRRRTLRVCERMAHYLNGETE